MLSVGALTGRWLMAREERHLAEEAVQRALAADADSPEALVLQGELFVDHRDWIHAHQTFRKALRFP